MTTKPSDTSALLAQYHDLNLSVVRAHDHARNEGATKGLMAYEHAKAQWQSIVHARNAIAARIVEAEHPETRVLGMVES